MDKSEVKTTKIVYGIFCVAGTAAIVFAARASGAQLNIFTVLLIFVGLAVAFFPIHLIFVAARGVIMTFKLEKKWKALRPILDDHCDAEKYLAELEGLVASVHGQIFMKPHPLLWPPVCLSLAEGHNFCGNYDRAVEIVEEVLATAKSGKRDDVAYRYSALMSLAGLYVVKKEPDKAREYRAMLPEYQATVSAWKADAKTKNLLDSWEKAVLWLDNAFLIDEGKFAEALPFYQKEWENGENNMLTKVIIRCSLSAIYKGLGEDEKYKECLAFVAEYGGNTYMAKQAREEVKMFDEGGVL